tara:strand:+ start:65 stop:985 length:921 start_codon:yes stop_codon:yes gene_type:complete
MCTQACLGRQIKKGPTMKNTPQHAPPLDAQQRLDIEPVVCYPNDTLPPYDKPFYNNLQQSMQLVDSITIPARDARSFVVPAGHVFRIISVEGPQVGDLNLWHKDNLKERFFSGKTRALHGTHVSTGDRLWSNLPYLRPMATVIDDTLDWYGWDQFGGSVHDVIGTRCDPYTNQALGQDEYHYCCHSNLTRAMLDHTQLDLDDVEPMVHDVLNVFMCTGFSHDTHQYFMKASPVRPGDHLTLFAEIDLLGALSACPGGDCSSEHSSDTSKCYPLKVDIYKPLRKALVGWSSPNTNGYSRRHGVDQTL